MGFFSFGAYSYACGHRLIYKKERRDGAVKFTELNCKEVICICDGRRLGFISDVRIELPEGRVVSIVVPGKNRLLGLCGCREDYVIPWHCIKRIGPDIVLVDVKPDDCRVPRPTVLGHHKL